MSKFYGLVVRWLFVSRNGIKVQVLGVVYFKSLYLTVFCVTSWFVQQKRKTHWNLCVLCWLNHLSWFPGTKNIPPSFWSWVTNHDVSQKCQKNDFLGHCSFYTNFSWCWKADEKTWNICKGHTKILVCTTCWRNRYVYLCLPFVSFSAVDIIISKEEEIFWPKTLIMLMIISFFGWMFGCFEAV